MKNFKILTLAAIMALAFLPDASAQRTAVTTNITDYAMLGTLNASVSYSTSRHWSLEAIAKYNPFSFNEGDPSRQMQNRQLLYSAGVRWWPWHTFSGWWLSSRAQWQEYNQGGILSPKTSEGNRIGAAVSAGYTYLLHKHFNLEFGLGVWSGYDFYATYDCPVCGLTVEEGRKFFFLPNDLILAFSYVF